MNDYVEEGKVFYTNIDGVEYKCILKNITFDYSKRSEYNVRLSMSKWVVDDRIVPSNFILRLFHSDESHWEKCAYIFEERSNFKIKDNKYFYQADFVRGMAKSALRSAEYGLIEDKKYKEEIKDIKHSDRI